MKLVQTKKNFAHQLNNFFKRHDLTFKKLEWHKIAREISELDINEEIVHIYKKIFALEDPDRSD